MRFRKFSAKLARKFSARFCSRRYSFAWCVYCNIKVGRSERDFLAALRVSTGAIAVSAPLSLSRLGSDQRLRKARRVFDGGCRHGVERGPGHQSHHILEPSFGFLSVSCWGGRAHRLATGKHSNVCSCSLLRSVAGGNRSLLSRGGAPDPPSSLSYERESHHILKLSFGFLLLVVIVRCYRGEVRPAPHLFFALGKRF